MWGVWGAAGFVLVCSTRVYVWISCVYVGEAGVCCVGCIMCVCVWRVQGGGGSVQCLTVQQSNHPL